MATPNQYPLYEHWYKTMNWLFDRCDRMPKHLRFTLTGRMVNLACWRPRQQPAFTPKK